jgi:hypothetical protein
MADVRKRRPLPALICLLALTLLTTLVWWRVLHRDDGKAQANSTCTPPSTQTSLPRPTTVTISVLNATKRTGLAKTTAGVLAKRGFKISGYSNDTVTLAGVAEIRYGTDQSAAASLLAYYLPGAKLVVLTAPKDSTVIISLGGKFKTVASTTAVKTAMTAAHVTVVPSGRPTPSPSPSC